jgi:ribonuclease D
LECLKDWRTDKANELKVAKYLVCHNSELINIAFHQPTTIAALQSIKGFGEKKVQRFGEDILALLNAV